MLDYEKLGVFYLGKVWDPAARALREEPLLYASKQLTTHAVVLGMTGSGKTGLSIGMLEEAAIDGVPCIAIDPKGDLGNLLLTFPDMAPGDFRPWIDAEEAARRGVSPDEWAATTADSWRKGLAEWDQDAARIQRLKDAAEVSVYTPGSSTGRPLALLRSFDPPKGEVDEEAMREQVSGAVSGLLGLLGVDADPLQSRDHILLSRILHEAWADGRDVDLAQLIGAIQQPSFTRMGVVDLDSFFPAKERFALAMQLNNLLASPGAAAWMEGEPLDIQALLFTAAGKPRVSVISIAHLSDAQRMFFVSTLLHAMVGWMRTQPGTSSLRAVLFMDEIYGYFPPTANPPSKAPMLTLLKQARAFGLGVVLATQNPVDLDYKGLSNCGAWFIGRLQTERDKARVLDGLEGAAPGLDRASMDTLLSGLGNRVFLLHNVHADGPVLFQTRWTLSYLRGPVTREEIKRLTRAAGATATPAVTKAVAAPAAVPAAAKPVLPVGVDERFLGAGTTYEAFLHGVAKVHYVDAKAGLDAWQDVSVFAPLVDDDRLADWSQATDVRDVSDRANADATYGDLPAHLSKKTAVADWKKSFAAWIYQERQATVFSCDALKLASTPGETEGVFRARLSHAAREHRDDAVEALKKKLEPKLDALEEKIRKAAARVDKEQAQATSATLSAAATWGSAIFGAVFGSGRSSVSKMATAARSTSRTMEQRADVGQAQADLTAAQEAEAELQTQLEAEVARITDETSPDALAIREVRVPARKADTQVVGVSLLWKSIDG